MTPSLQSLARELAPSFTRYMPKAPAPVDSYRQHRLKQVRDCMRRRRAAFRAQGLNTAGKPKKADNGRTRATMSHPDAKNSPQTAQGAWRGIVVKK